MSTLVKVARFHVVRSTQYLLVPWLITAFSFAFTLVDPGLRQTGQSAGQSVGPGAHALVAPVLVHFTGMQVSFFTFFFVLGVQSIGRSLPFGLALGMSRRSYYTGTALLAAALACADGLVFAVLQAIERGTDGWGLRMGFFRVPYILNGPWYQTWLTVFVGVTLLFAYGMWYGTVHRRWGIIGTLAFIAAQAAVVVAVTMAFSWASLGHFFTGLTAVGLSGLLAALALALLAGGHATIRRVTV